MPDDKVDLDVYEAVLSISLVATEEVARLQTEVERLRNIEAMRDLIQGELDGLREKLNQERLSTARLKDAIDGLSLDMSLMEDRISELSGRTEIVPDYGP